MFTIISQNYFKTVPWKNGKGETTELAINEGANLASFDWRISIASVVENGLFSDFSGYQRNLVLIEGNGIELCHDQKQTDKLNSLLEFSTFNGASATEGYLPNGAIKDFNIITDENKFEVTVRTSVDKTKLAIPQEGLTFVYSLSGDVEIKQDSQEDIKVLPQGDLLQILNRKNVSVLGTMIIMVNLAEK